MYVNDILILDKKHKKYMHIDEDSNIVKPSIIGNPKVYPGADIGKIYYPDGSYAWTMRSKSYTKQKLRMYIRNRRDSIYVSTENNQMWNTSPQNPSMLYLIELNYIRW